MLIGIFELHAQKNKKTLDSIYNKTIDDFVLSTKNNLSFVNGSHTYISRPLNDRNALKKGFKLTHTDQEDKGGWRLLYAKDVVINPYGHDEKGYRAVLYNYQNKEYIVLYRKEKPNKYYFRIYNSKFTNFSPRL